MPDLPSGTVTFVFTDVENSTRMWEQHPAAMHFALARHDSLACDIVEQHGGTLVKPRGEGDSLFLVFARASDALHAASALQQALLTEPWSPETPLRVRMALHTGETNLRDEDYYGSTVNRCARIRAVAHGSQILLSQTTVDLIRDHLPPDVSLQDMGSHRLKDLQRPERLWQLRHPDWPGDFPPLRSLEIFKHNLPRQLTSFIGREREMQAVQKMLGQTCLLTLMGAGGCGKTRLALQVAAELVDAYADGVWFVELGALADPRLVARVIGKTFGLREEPEHDALDTLCDHLRAKSLLLVLDNCEHLVGEAARTINTLMQDCPNLRILATSRLRLNVPGEKQWRVPSLSVPDKNALPTVEEALNNPAISLFVERALAARSEFALTPLNLPAVAHICRRLDGIPLAIELAAARANALTPQQLADRLDNRFSLLIGSSRTALGRHQTLRALIDWSYDLLDEAQKTLLRRLSIFVGGWTLEAAESVCAWGELEAEQILELQSQLVDASLIIAEEQGEELRYRLLETVREYAGHRLAEAQGKEFTQERHVQFFLALAEEAEPHLIATSQAAWLDKLEAEHDNLRAALALAIGGDTRLRLASALWRFWLRRSYFAEGSAWLRGALAYCSRASERVRAKALNGLGVFASRQCDHETAAGLLNESLQLRRQFADAWGMAETLNNLGCVARDQGDYAQAQTYYEESLDIGRRVGDRWGTAACLSNLGMTMLSLDNYARAQTYFEESLGIYRQLDDIAQIASVSTNLGMIALNQHDYTTARPLFEEALTIFRQMHSNWSVAILCYNLGIATYNIGDIPQAQALYVESMLLSHELGDRNGIAYTLIGLADVACAQQEYRRSAQLYAASAHLRDLHAISLSASDQAELDQDIAIVRAGLSEDGFAAEWSQGAALSYEEIVSFAQRE